jgi:hypothetical protein
MTGQMVGVDLWHGEYIVCTYSKTPMGVWVLDGTPARLPQDSTTDRLGAVVRDALAQSRVGVDELTRDSQPSRPLLDLLQVPDFATYAKGTLSVEVYSEPSGDGETVEVTPRRNEGARRGFTPMNDEMQTFVYGSPGATRHCGD